MKLRAIWIVMLVMAVGLLTYSPTAMASHLGGSQGHTDYVQINDTQSLGIKHRDFATGFTQTDCVGGVDLGGLHTGGDCSGHAFEAISAWLAGQWWDPRGGTEFIPPSGDHHRSGWRMMLQPAFSAGKWLAGFAPLASTFPFYPDLSAGPGPGESPIIVYELCLQRASASDPDGLGEGADNNVIPPGETVGCRDQAKRAGELIAMFMDNHGEPLTPGRFPRYVPHERQAWVGTVVSKYTASSDVGIPNIDTDGNNVADTEGGKINQLFTSMMKTISDRSVTWFTMSDQSGAGCAGGWCQWKWDPFAATADAQLQRVNRPPDNPYWVQTNPDPDFETSGVATITNVTNFTVANEVSGQYFTRGLSTIEKAPVEIYQVVGQFLQLGLGQAFGIEDPGAAGAGFPLGVPSQNFWSEFWGIAGPNVQAHEAVNPYTWLTCGTNSVDFNCNGTTGANNAPSFAGCPIGAGGVPRCTMAVTQFGIDPANRFGGDMRPGNDPGTDFGNIDANGNGIVNEASDLDGDCSDAGEGAACDAGLRTAMVACVPGGDADNDPRTSSCLSTAGGGDGIYGNGTGDIIYYKEIVEEGLRGAGLRHDRAYAFSFLNRLGENTGTPSPAPFSVAAGSGLDHTLRQVVTDTQQGFLMSCLNCEDTPLHPLPVHDLIYNFTFNQTVPGFFGAHGSNISGTIPFSGGGP